jgi:hypothetical protein
LSSPLSLLLSLLLSWQQEGGEGDAGERAHYSLTNIYELCV